MVMSAKHRSINFHPFTDKGVISIQSKKFLESDQKQQTNKQSIQRMPGIIYFRFFQWENCSDNAVFWHLIVLYTAKNQSSSLA